MISPKSDVPTWALYGRILLMWGMIQGYLIYKLITRWIRRNKFKKAQEQLTKARLYLNMYTFFKERHGRILPHLAEEAERLARETEIPEEE